MGLNAFLNLDVDMELHLLMLPLNMDNGDADADDYDCDDGVVVDTAFEMEQDEQVDLNQMNKSMMLMIKT